jgi:hypothetical protein
VVRKRDIELRLNSPIGSSMSFGETKQRLVARVKRKSFGEPVAFR